MSISDSHARNSDNFFKVRFPKLNLETHLEIDFAMRLELDIVEFLHEEILLGVLLFFESAELFGVVLVLVEKGVLFLFILPCGNRPWPRS